MNVRLTHPRQRAFTLTEMLIVMGIIVVVALVAIPSFRALTGGRSLEGAQNQISAAMARARTEALGLQEVRGILFYRDPDTKRIGLTIVKARNTGAPWILDLVPDRDTLLLPAGVGVQMIATNPINDRYLGYIDYDKTNPKPAVAYGGAILFDGQGRLIADQYRMGVRVDPDGIGPQPYIATEMGRFLYSDPSLAGGTAANATLPAPADQPFTASVGMVLFDEDEFTSNNNKADGHSADYDTDVGGQAFPGTPPMAGNGPYSPEEATEEQWLDEHATPVLVNRYNGTLVRSQ
jgi:prepilin-type N-terminal cleavage/methylation domain-containing protein